MLVNKLQQIEVSKAIDNKNEKVNKANTIKRVKISLTHDRKCEKGFVPCRNATGIWEEEKHPRSVSKGTADGEKEGGSL